MTDIILKLYHLINESLPILPYQDTAEQAFYKTLTEEQRILFEDYQRERFYHAEGERRQLFRYLISLGLYIP